MFCVYQCLVIPFIGPANHAPRVQIGHAQRVASAIKIFYSLKNYSNYFDDLFYCCVTADILTTFTAMLLVFHCYTFDYL